MLIFLFFFDQISKKVILDSVGMYNTANFLPGIIDFNVVQNTGGAFSMLNQYPIFFEIVGIVNIFIFSYLSFSPKVNFHTIARYGCVFVLSGTLGNISDRLMHGAVIDFLELAFVDFAVFNMADVFIDVGVVLILIGWYIQENNLSRA